MKVVLITVDDAKKTELKGAEKLTKNDILVLMSAKAKADMPATVKEYLEEVKATVEYVKLETASDVTAAYAYYAGLHEGKNHQVFIVAPDKTKLPSVVAKQIKIYTSFASVVKSDGSSSKSSSTKTSSKSSSKSSSSKSSSTKKSTTKKSSSSSSSKSSSTETLITDTISSLTGLSKSQAKKLVKGFTEGKQE